MATFGLDSGDATWAEGANYLVGMRFQNDALTGTLTKLEILIDDASPNGSVRLGVYADNAGVPGALLLDAGVVAVADGWIEIGSLSLGVTLNDYYWLVFLYQNANNTRYLNNQAEGSCTWKAFSYGALPNPFGTPAGNSNDQDVMRATVEGAAPQTISPTAIASAEAFGTPAMSPGAVTLQPTSIASVEAFGTPVVSLAGIILYPTSIASAEAFGTLVIVVGGVTLLPSSITSLEAFGTPTVTGALFIYPTSIASLEAFGTPALVYVQFIEPTSIASAEAFGTPTISAFWLSITIGGVERYVSVRLSTLRIESVLTQQIDRCEFDLEDTTGDITITELAELIVKLDNIRRFAGFIQSTETQREGLTKVFRAAADDYSLLPEFVIVNEICEDMTDKAIIQDIFTNYLSEITTTDYVSTGKTIDRIVFNRKSIRECLNELASFSGFDWYIDYNKKLHYFAKEENPAPFGLSDEPDYSTTYPFRMLSYEKDVTKLVNVQTVRGGTWLTEDLTYYYPGDGVNKNLLINYPLQPEDGQNQIRVWRNNGTQGSPVWQALTVGVDGVDAASGKDVLYNQEQKLLKFWAATPNFETSVKVMGRAELPILVRVRSQASKDTYGRWMEGKPITDKDISSKKIARERGKAELAEHAFVKEQGTLICHQDGLVVGQLLPIKNSIRGIDGSYLIRRLVTRFLGGRVPEYQVEFGEYNPDLIDLLVGLRRASGQYQGVFDERLEELLDHRETLALSGVRTKAAHTAQDYYWVNGGLDIGAPAIDRGGYLNANWTCIGKDNPANVAGKITSVELWPKTDLTNCKVGTFYGSGLNYTCRSYGVITSVKAVGGKQVIAGFSINAEVGDYIGICCGGGNLELDLTGFGGAYMKSGDHFGDGEQTYEERGGYAMSLYGDAPSFWDFGTWAD